MSELIDLINVVHREVGKGEIPAGTGRSVLLRRTYDAGIEDVWDALTSPERIARWFLEVTGDLRLGGRYQLVGNAGGEILVCDRPTTLKVTWEFGEAPPGEVEVRLTDREGKTEFELEHIAVVDPDTWGQYGPGAVGVGWDLTVLGLGLHLAGGMIEDPEAWSATAEAAEYMTRSSELWGTALLAAGGTEDEVSRAVANTTAFYVPPPAEDAGTGSEQ